MTSKQVNTPKIKAQAGHGTRIGRLEFLLIIQKEVATAHEMVKLFKTTDQFEAGAKFRILVRTTHACLESLLFFLKLDALTAHEIGVVEFSPGDVEKLKEQKLNKEGKLVPVKLKFLKTARLAIRCYDAANGGPTKVGKSLLQLPTEFELWPKLRNRVTHPKCLSDLEVSMNELSLLEKIVRWYLQITKWVSDVERSRVEGTYADSMDIIARMFELSKSGVTGGERMNELLKILTRVQNV